MNSRHFCQGVGMSTRTQTLSELIGRRDVRHAQLILASLSMVASPATADGRAGPNPPSLRVDPTVSASPTLQDHPTNTTQRPSSATCFPDTQMLVLFDRLDRDSDGRLTRTDIRRREAGRDRIRVVAPDRHTRLDLDGNGIATRQEVIAASSCASLMRQDHMQPADEALSSAQTRVRPAD